ncbi:MAG: L-serine ammonia-lyase, iron-sulfur-dependent, subunit alpha, partial [Angelakisella sp.]
MNFISAKELLDICDSCSVAISEAMLNRETDCMGGKRQELVERMTRALSIMRSGVELALSAPQKSMGGLIGGEAIKLAAHRQAGKSVCGQMMSKAVTYAMGMLEVNASMGLIVAAPTAGSCGVLPAALL